MQKITTAISHRLFSAAATRGIEARAASTLPPHSLMQRAGLAVARLALAIAPHAKRIWVACGPGNNGGDGFEAALHLHSWGKEVVLTWTGLPLGKALPADAQASSQRALAAGIVLATQAPEEFDFCIDALLGLGGRLDPARPGSALMQQWLNIMVASGRPRLCIDLPTGLDADTGQSSHMANAADIVDFADAAGITGATVAIKSVANSGRLMGATGIYTLSLLTLKPGLFTASGRDCAGEVWFDNLDVEAKSFSPPAVLWLLGRDRATSSSRANATQASHKGSFGDVAVLGGESTLGSHMAGAALLAGRAALHAGAGRVFVALTGNAEAGLKVDVAQPELMFRSPEALDLKQQTIVCGCGGGDAIRQWLPRVLSGAPRLVLDADALNAIAADTTLQVLLKSRQGRGYITVLTPHPLEAGRLAGITASAVQADRLKAAATLAEKFACVVALKGSGTVIAALGQPLMVNTSGNALLATAGTGDVLAGMVGAYLASGMKAFEAACSAVFVHGDRADQWLRNSPQQVLTASKLAMQAD